MQTKLRAVISHETFRSAGNRDQRIKVIVLTLAEFAFYFHIDASFI